MGRSTRQSVGFALFFKCEWERETTLLYACHFVFINKSMKTGYYISHWRYHYWAMVLCEFALLFLCSFVFFFKEKENKNSVILRYVTKCLSLVYLFKHLSSYLHWYTLYTHTRKKKTGGVLFCKYKESINLKKNKKWNNHQIWSKDIVQIY